MSHAFPALSIGTAVALPLPPTTPYFVEIPTDGQLQCPFTDSLHEKRSHFCKATLAPSLSCDGCSVVVRMDCDGGDHPSAVVHDSTALKSLSLDAWGLCGRAAVHCFHYAGAS